MQFEFASSGISTLDDPGFAQLFFVERGDVDVVLFAAAAFSVHSDRMDFAGEGFALNMRVWSRNQARWRGGLSEASSSLRQ